MTKYKSTKSKKYKNTKVQSTKQKRTKIQKMQKCKKREKHKKYKSTKIKKTLSWREAHSSTGRLVTGWAGQKTKLGITRSIFELEARNFACK